MDSLRWCLLALLLAVGCAGSPSSHSLRNFRMAVSEPGPGLPQFIAVGYVDDQPIVHYDSHTRRMMPVAPWMKKAEQDEPRYFEEESQGFRGIEKHFRESLEMLMAHFHHHRSTGPHTLQLMFSCEVWPDGRPSGGSWKYGYDGKDLLALNMETTTWMVFVPLAKTLKQTLDPLLGDPQHRKHYLDEICVDWLRKYLDYGNETLQRTESPMVKVASKKGDDGRETLFCQVYGFYPKEIEVSWMKDGEDRRQDTLTGGVIPNSDGTYHTWLSTEVDPKDRDHYRCHVEHDALQEPVDLAWEEPASILGLILGIAGGVLVAGILVVAGVTFYIRCVFHMRCHSEFEEDMPSSFEFMDNGHVSYPSRHGEVVQKYIPARKRKMVQRDEDRDQMVDKSRFGDKSRLRQRR
ncbi:UNVERIFIED_CONTAM: hypothetical protein K2H54_065250 [Gekko kuhli]